MNNELEKMIDEIEKDMWDIANDFDWVGNTKENGIVLLDTGDPVCRCDKCEKAWSEKFLELGSGFVCHMCCGVDICNGVKFDKYALYNWGFNEFYKQWTTGEFKDKDFNSIDNKTLWETTKNYLINNSLIIKSKIIADVRYHKDDDLEINNIEPELVEKVKWDKNKKLSNNENSKYFKISSIDEGVVFPPVLLVCDDCREKIGKTLDEKYKNNPIKKEKLEKVVFTLLDKYINSKRKENNKTLEKER